MNHRNLPITIDLLRHGEVEGGKRYNGNTNQLLTEYGRLQMWQAINHQHPWDRVISSPLRRCKDFAEELNIKYNLPICIDERLKEINFGLWEGKTAEELLTTDSLAIQNYWRNPTHHTPPEGELFDTFKNRVLQAWDQSIQRSAGEHLLVIAHAGSIRIILCHILNMPVQSLFRLEVGHACLSRINVDYINKKPVPRLTFHAGKL